MVINRKDENRVTGSMINKNGAYICKIEKVENDGTTSTGDIKIKFSFICLDVENLKGEQYTYSESFPLTGKASFLINAFEEALKCPDVYDASDLVGRYVLGHFAENKYTDKNGTEKTNFKSTKWEYSSKNDKLPPIQAPKENESSNYIEDEDLGF